MVGTRKLKAIISRCGTNLRLLVVVDLCKYMCRDIVVACIVLAYELPGIPVFAWTEKKRNIGK